MNSIWPTNSKPFVWWLGDVSSVLRTLLAVSDGSVIWPVDKLPPSGESITTIVVGASQGFSGAATLYVYGR